MATKLSEQMNELEKAALLLYRGIMLIYREMHYYMGDANSDMWHIHVKARPSVTLVGG